MNDPRISVVFWSQAEARSWAFVGGYKIKVERWCTGRNTDTSKIYEQSRGQIRWGTASTYDQSVWVIKVRFKHFIVEISCSLGCLRMGRWRWGRCRGLENDLLCTRDPGDVTACGRVDRFLGDRETGTENETSTKRQKDKSRAEDEEEKGQNLVHPRQAVFVA